MGKRPSQTPHQKYILQLIKKSMEKCSTSYAIREQQIKTLRYHHTLIRMTKIQDTGNMK